MKETKKAVTKPAKAVTVKAKEPAPVDTAASTVSPEKTKNVKDSKPVKDAKPKELRERSPRPRQHRSAASSKDSQQRDQREQRDPRDQRSRYGNGRREKESAPRVLSEMSYQELCQYSRRFGVIGAARMKKDVLIKRIEEIQANPDKEIEVSGVLEKLPDGFGFLRSSTSDYVSGPDDIYVSPSQTRRFNLRTGDSVTGVIRKPKEGEKYFALLKVSTINNGDPKESSERSYFDQLSPTHPYEKFALETDPTGIATRIMDIFTPIGKGQRGLIVAPPKAGKTVLLKDIAQSLLVNNPNLYLIVLLIDERPEEVAELKRDIKGKYAEVVSSTFDESAQRHVQVAEIVLEKAKRLVESGKDVVILLDSITRLARAYNTTAPASGKVLTGGIDANALQRPKRFFGAARKVEEGGSLTIIGTALIETGSRMDEVIFEEFKGTGNMELHMNRKLSNRRIYPAFELLVSGTRRDDLLHSEADLKHLWVLQKFLSTMNTIEGMEFLIDKMKKNKTNAEFLESINKKTGGNGNGRGKLD
ncbi:MAG TPA: transcription termination factor Rho [Candidatus Babeliales bacterium]|nr:transcription termination factor Rho [Candidatus Babeliales bacterium]